MTAVAVGRGRSRQASKGRLASRSPAVKEDETAGLFENTVSMVRLWI